VEEN
jgi:hypothetical protein